MIAISPTYYNRFSNNTKYFIYKEEMFSFEYCNNAFTVIKNRCHAKAIQRKIKSKNVRIGDVFYNEITTNSGYRKYFGYPWYNFKDAYAIERNNEIVLFSFPALLGDTRIVLFEKHKK